MNALGLAAFDLALTSTIAFWVSVGIAAAVLATTRLRGTTVAVVLALAPFLKVGLDLVRGAGRAGHVAIATGEGIATPGGSFSVGLGLAQGRLEVQALLSKNVGEGAVPVTLGDHLATAASPGARSFLAGLGGLLLAGSAAFVLRRVLATARFERERRRLRRTAARRISRAGGIDVYVSYAHRGSPFAGGCLRPYVCVPVEAMRLLSRGERRAALAHEIAHHRSGDLWIRHAVAIVVDLFWFIPGIRGRAARAYAELELHADRGAVAAGTPRKDLASALVSIAELGVADEPRPGVVGAIDGASLRARIEALAESAPSSRRGFGRLPVRLLVAVVAVQTVLFAVVGGFRF